jgi:polysaccharide export outer membrane protein
VPHAISEAQFARFVADETEALSVETSAFEKQIELIRSKKPQFVAETAAIEGQISSEKKQLALVQKQVAAYSQLAKEGLSRLNSQIEVQLNEANKQSNIWRLEADRSRLNGTIVELDLRTQDVENAYKRHNLTELEDVRQRLHEIEVTLPLSEQVRSLRLQQTGGPPELSPLLEIVITRLRETEVTSFAATETTFLEPGDIIEVRVLRSTGEARAGLVENAPKISSKSR